MTAKQLGAGSLIFGAVYTAWKVGQLVQGGKPAGEALGAVLTSNSLAMGTLLLGAVVYFGADAP